MAGAEMITNLASAPALNLDEPRSFKFLTRPFQAIKFLRNRLPRRLLLLSSASSIHEEADKQGLVILDRLVESSFELLCI